MRTTGNKEFDQFAVLVNKAGKLQLCDLVAQTAGVSPAFAVRVFLALQIIASEFDMHVDEIVFRNYAPSQATTLEQEYLENVYTWLYETDRYAISLYAIEQLV